MKNNSGQRQDVAFLALAVAVLAIACALFVGMKSMHRPAAKKVEAQPAAAAKVAAPLVQKPTGGPRDPFKTEGAAKGAGARDGAAGAGGAAAPTLTLVGIISQRGGEPIAVIRSPKKRYYAKVGQHAAGYTVVSVSSGGAVVEKDGDRMTLLLHQPETEEE